MTQTDDGARIRAETMVTLRRHAAKLFARAPYLRSVMMLVAQYWADEADDAVHAHLVASERAIPIWPHACDLPEADDANPDRISGELCWNCGGGDGHPDLGYLDFDDNNAGIEGFAAFCTEAGSQEARPAENYVPYAIARTTGEPGAENQIEIEIVGTRQRHVEPRATRPASMAWPDARARALFADVCANPADDAARHVLADHLLELGDVRGELIALSLATPLDVAGRARRDALIADAVARHPLAAVIAEDGARFSRGFLAHAEIFATHTGAVAVRGHEAWGTVESLWFAPRTFNVLDPAMVALREVGSLCAGQISVLAKARKPWAIETLHLVLADTKSIDARQLNELVEIETLPRLTHLAVTRGFAAAAMISRAPWFAQLEQLTLLDPDGPGADWHAKRGLEALPVLAVASCDDLDRPAGWHVAYHRKPNRAEITMPGWHRAASFGALAQLIAGLPDGATAALAASRCYVPAQADADRLASQTGRAVTLAVT